MNAGAEKSFTLYTEQWDFIVKYHTKYREVPSRQVFQDEFPDWDIIDTDGVIEHYIEKLHNWKAQHVLQELLTGGAQSLRSSGPFSTINSMQAELSRLARDTKVSRDVDLIANADERIESLRERVQLKASGRKIIGIPSGIAALDEKFGGWQPGDFIVLAGWTGSLKSWLAMLFARNAWMEGYRVLYISLEMSGQQVGYRFDTMLSGYQGQDFTLGGLTHAENITFDSYRHWLGEVTRDKHPFVVVTNEEIEEVNQLTVQAKMEIWKPDLVILDYHGLFDDAGGATGETEKAKNLSKAFKRLALKTGTPIIDITAVTMSGDHGDRPPELNEMAWTKQLAFDADLCLALCNTPGAGEHGGSSLEVVSRKSRRSAEIRFWLDWQVDRGIVKERSRAANAFGLINEGNDRDEQDKVF